MLAHCARNYWRISAATVSLAPRQRRLEFGRRARCQRRRRHWGPWCGPCWRGLALPSSPLPSSFAAAGLCLAGFPALCSAGFVGFWSSGVTASWSPDLAAAVLRLARFLTGLGGNLRFELGDLVRRARRAGIDDDRRYRTRIEQQVTFLGARRAQRRQHDGKFRTGSVSPARCRRLVAEIGVRIVFLGGRHALAVPAAHFVLQIGRRGIDRRRAHRPCRARASTTTADSD